jgi:hydrogenase-4 component H
MRYPKLREFKEALKSFFSRPYTIKFPKEASLASPRYRGKPQYYKDDCVGCGACAQVCPSSTIYLTDDLKTHIRTLVLRLDSCIFCGNCQANCITEKGIMLSTEYDLSTYERESSTVSVEKELVVCEHCDCVIGAKDHLKFLARKLGVLAYGNPTLILANQDNLKLADSENIKKRKSETELGVKSAAEPAEGRPAIFKVLCPRCRRESMIKEEYGGL